MTDVPLPGQRPEAITRPARHVQAVSAQSLLEMGGDGRAALAWAWALTGTRPSPVTLSLPTGSPPSRQQILAEADAAPEGSTAAPGVPTDYCDQLREARRVLAWVARASDEIPVDCDNCGRLVGARDNYVRTDEDIRRARDHARAGLRAGDLPDFIDPAYARSPWRWDPGWMDAAWLRAVRDLLDWVLGERPAAPLSGRVIGLPSTGGLTYEDSAARDVSAQGHPGGIAVDPGGLPPPQYGEAIQATIRWLLGESVTPPVDDRGRGPYKATS